MTQYTYLNNNNPVSQVENPKRDVPLGIMISLLLSCILYVGVSLVITGMVPYYDIDVSSPLATAFNGKTKKQQYIAS